MNEGKEQVQHQHTVDAHVKSTILQGRSNEGDLRAADRAAFQKFKTAAKRIIVTREVLDLLYGASKDLSNAQKQYEAGTLLPSQTPVASNAASGQQQQQQQQQQQTAAQGHLSQLRTATTAPPASSTNNYTAAWQGPAAGSSHARRTAGKKTEKQDWGHFKMMGALRVAPAAAAARLSPEASPRPVQPGLSVGAATRAEWDAWELVDEEQAMQAEAGWRELLAEKRARRKSRNGELEVRHAAARMIQATWRLHHHRLVQHATRLLDERLGAASRRTTEEDAFYPYRYSSSTRRRTGSISHISPSGSFISRDRSPRRVSRERSPPPSHPAEAAAAAAATAAAAAKDGDWDAAIAAAAEAAAAAAAAAVAEAAACSRDSSPPQQRQRNSKAVTVEVKPRKAPAQRPQPMSVAVGRDGLAIKTAVPNTKWKAVARTAIAANSLAHLNGGTDAAEHGPQQYDGNNIDDTAVPGAEGTVGGTALAADGIDVLASCSGKFDSRAVTPERSYESDQAVLSREHSTWDAAAADNGTPAAPWPAAPAGAAAASYAATCDDACAEFSLSGHAMPALGAAGLQQSRPVHQQQQEKDCQPQLLPLPLPQQQQRKNMSQHVQATSEQQGNFLQQQLSLQQQQQHQEQQQVLQAAPLQQQQQQQQQAAMPDLKPALSPRRPPGVRDPQQQERAKLQQKIQQKLVDLIPELAPKPAQQEKQGQGAAALAAAPPTTATAAVAISDAAAGSPGSNVTDLTGLAVVYEQSPAAADSRFTTASSHGYYAVEEQQEPAELGPREQQQQQPDLYSGTSNASSFKSCHQGDTGEQQELHQDGPGALSPTAAAATAAPEVVATAASTPGTSCEACLLSLAGGVPATRSAAGTVLSLAGGVLAHGDNRTADHQAGNAGSSSSVYRGSSLSLTGGWFAAQTAKASMPELQQEQMISHSWLNVAANKSSGSTVVLAQLADDDKRDSDFDVRARLQDSVQLGPQQVALQQQQQQQPQQVVKQLLQQQQRAQQQQQQQWQQQEEETMVLEEAGKVHSHWVQLQQQQQGVQHLQQQQQQQQTEQQELCMDGNLQPGVDAGVSAQPRPAQQQQRSTAHPNQQPSVGTASAVVPERSPSNTVNKQASQFVTKQQLMAPRQEAVTSAVVQTRQQQLLVQQQHLLVQPQQQQQQQGQLPLHQQQQQQRVHMQQLSLDVLPLVPSEGSLGGVSPKQTGTPKQLETPSQQQQQQQQQQQRSSSPYAMLRPTTSPPGSGGFKPSPPKEGSKSSTVSPREGQGTLSPSLTREATPPGLNGLLKATTAVAAPSAAVASAAAAAGAAAGDVSNREGLQLVVVEGQLTAAVQQPRSPHALRAAVPGLMASSPAAATAAEAAAAPGAATAAAAAAATRGSPAVSAAPLQLMVTNGGAASSGAGTPGTAVPRPARRSAAPAPTELSTAAAQDGSSMGVAATTTAAAAAAAAASLFSAGVRVTPGAEGLSGVTQARAVGLSPRAARGIVKSPKAVTPVVTEAILAAAPDTVTVRRAAENGADHTGIAAADAAAAAAAETAAVACPVAEPASSTAQRVAATAGFAMDGTTADVYCSAADAAAAPGSGSASINGNHDAEFSCSRTLETSVEAAAATTGSGGSSSAAADPGSNRGSSVAKQPAGSVSGTQVSQLSSLGQKLASARHMALNTDAAFRLAHQVDGSSSSSSSVLPKSAISIDRSSADGSNTAATGPLPVRVGPRLSSTGGDSGSSSNGEQSEVQAGSSCSGTQQGSESFSGAQLGSLRADFIPSICEAGGSAGSTSDARRSSTGGSISGGAFCSQRAARIGSSDNGSRHASSSSSSMPTVALGGPGRLQPLQLSTPVCVTAAPAAAAAGGSAPSQHAASSGGALLHDQQPSTSTAAAVAQEEVVSQQRVEVIPLKPAPQNNETGTQQQGRLAGMLAHTARLAPSLNAPMQKPMLAQVPAVPTKAVAAAATGASSPAGSSTGRGGHSPTPALGYRAMSASPVQQRVGLPAALSDMTTLGRQQVKQSLHESLEFLRGVWPVGGLGSGHAIDNSSSSSPNATGTYAWPVSPLFGGPAAAAVGSVCSSAMGSPNGSTGRSGLATQERTGLQPRYDVISSLKAASFAALSGAAGPASGNSSSSSSPTAGAAAAPVVMSVAVGGVGHFGPSSLTTMGRGTGSVSPAGAFVLGQQLHMRSRTKTSSGSGSVHDGGLPAAPAAGSPPGIGVFAAGLLPALNNARRKTLL